MTINFTDKPIFLCRENSDLNETVRSLVAKVSTYIDHKYQCSQINDYSQITAATSGDSLICYFKKFFVLSPFSSEIFYDQTWVMQAFNFVNSEQGGDKEKQMRHLLGAGYTDYRATGASSLRKGLWLLLVLLFKHGVILLPANFKALREKISDGKFTDFGFEEYPELVRFFISARHKIYTDRFWEGIDLKVCERVAQYGTRLCWITGARSPEELSLNTILKVYEEFYYNKNKLAAEIPIKTIIPFLVKKYWGRVAFSTDQLLSNLDHLAAARRDISQGVREVSGSKLLNEEQIIDVCRSLTRARFFPVSLSKAGYPPAALGRIDSWVEYQLTYLDVNSYERLKPAQYGFGVLNIYLLVYLPLWFDNFSEGNRDCFPERPSQFEALYQAPLYREPGNPMPFNQFVGAILDSKAQSTYTAITQIHRFFCWLQVKASSSSSLAVKGFENAITNSDIPYSKSFTNTEKRSFSLLEYSVGLNYLYCLLGALVVLNDAILEGRADIGRWSNFHKKAMSYGWVPEFKLKGRTFRVDSLPSILFPKWRVLLRSDEHKTIIAPHRIVHLLTALDSGLRHQSVQWLGCDYAEEFPDIINADACYFIKVAVDKVRTDPLPSCVSGRTAIALNYQKKIRDLIQSGAFDRYQFYEGNKESRFKEMIPLFSFNLQSGMPYADAYYKLGFESFLSGLQRLLRSSNIDCRLIEIKPKKIGFGEPVRSECVEVEYIDSIPYCPVEYVTDFSPHCTRVSLVTNYSSFISEENIGRYKTGQSLAVVRYYNKQVPQRASKDLAEINSGISDIWSGAAIQAAHKNSAFRKAIEISPEAAMDDFKCLTTPSHGNSNATTGVEQIKLRTHRGLAHHSTHVCTRNNNCNMNFRCGVCNFSVSGLDHLEAIEVKIYCFEEEIRELHSYADELDVDTCSSELEVIDEKLRAAAVELVGWEWRRANLIRHFTGIEKDKYSFITLRPELLDRELISIELDSHSHQYIMARVYQAAQFPNISNEVVRAGFRSFINSVLSGNLSVFRGSELSGTVSPLQFVECIKEHSRRNGLGISDLVEMLSVPAVSDKISLI